MKNKVIFLLAAFATIIITICLYGILRMEEMASELNKLLINHEAEIIRRNLSEKIKMAFGHLNNSIHEDRIGIILSDTKEIRDFIDQCLRCHHSQRMKEKIEDLRNGLEDYGFTLNKAWTMKGHQNQRQVEEQKVYWQGQQLVEAMESLIGQASSRLTEKKRLSFINIERTKKILFLLLITAPTLIVVTSIIVVKNFSKISKPLYAILNFLRPSRNGTSSFRKKTIWKDEFSELVAALNEMNCALNEQIIKMQRAEQLALCGQFAAGLAHEIKNPLASIKVALKIFAEESAFSHENQGTLKLIISEIERIELLLKKLLEFARPSKPQLERVNINAILENTISFLQKQSSSLSPKNGKIEIVKEFADNLPDILADPEQLRQVFINLLVNAKEAMPEGGTVTIKTKLIPPGSIDISISDTGPGIPINFLDKIFEPFFTTKPSGTGLGLAITKRLVEQQGGWIKVECNHQPGATFKIKFPIIKSENSEDCIKWPRSLLLRTMN